MSFVQKNNTAEQLKNLSGPHPLAVIGRGGSAGMKKRKAAKAKKTGAR